MAQSKNRPSRQTVVEMARLVGLNLTDDQLAKIDADLDGLTRNIETLQAADLGEMEPATTFRPDAGQR